MAQDNKLTSADGAICLFLFYFFGITLPGSVFVIGIEYRIYNCSSMMMFATAFLIATPNLYFLLRAMKCCEEWPENMKDDFTDKHPVLVTIVIALTLYSFGFSLVLGCIFFSCR